MCPGLIGVLAIIALTVAAVVYILTQARSTKDVENR